MIGSRSSKLSPHFPLPLCVTYISTYLHTHRTYTCPLAPQILPNTFSIAGFHMLPAFCSAVTHILCSYSLSPPLLSSVCLVSKTVKDNEISVSSKTISHDKTMTSDTSEGKQNANNPQSRTGWKDNRSKQELFDKWIQEGEAQKIKTIKWWMSVIQNYITSMDIEV